MCPTQGESPAPTRQPAVSRLAICFGLVVATLAVYGQAVHYDFANIDDGDYVYSNEHVKAGLTPETVRWSLTAEVAGNWMPLTLLSHMLVCEVFDLKGGMHHFVNVLLHILTALLLFAALRRATGADGASAFVAFVFALHPLHVESVAWISERKDVLSGLFFFLALYAYVYYTESPSVRRYLLVVTPFGLGLMSKPMLVTFPFALLLFDVWPLRRRLSSRILLEKLPLFALAAATSVLTYFAQRSAGAVNPLPIPIRLENCIISYIVYIRQIFWPVDLAVFYPFPEAIPLWQPVGALAILLGITIMALLTRRTFPYFLTGWCWYLGMLVPVIGLVQVGGQSHADRYTYLPMVGLLWILAWGAADLLKTLPGAWRTPLAVTLGGIICAVCAVLAWQQTQYWRDGITVAKRAVDITANTWALQNLARAHRRLAYNLVHAGGHDTEAMDHLEEALRIWPDYADAHNQLGILLARVPMLSGEAIAHFEAAVRLNPDMAEAQRNLGLVLASTPDREAEALAHLQIAQHLQPDPVLLKQIDRLQSHGRAN